LIECLRTGPRSDGFAAEVRQHAGDNFEHAWIIIDSKHDVAHGGYLYHPDGRSTRSNFASSFGDRRIGC
jgi:elongation factor P hydroxylase